MPVEVAFDGPGEVEDGAAPVVPGRPLERALLRVAEPISDPVVALVLGMVVEGRAEDGMAVEGMVMAGGEPEGGIGEGAMLEGVAGPVPSGAPAESWAGWV